MYGLRRRGTHSQTAATIFRRFDGIHTERSVVRAVWLGDARAGILLKSGLEASYAVDT